MEVIQLPAGTSAGVGAGAATSVGSSCTTKSRAQYERQSQISLLTTSSSTTPTPSLASPSSSAAFFRYSVSSTSSSVVSASSPFFLNDEDVEELSRSNTSSPADFSSVPPYHFATAAAAAPASCTGPANSVTAAATTLARRRPQYRSSFSRPVSCCNHHSKGIGSSSAAVSAVSCDPATALNNDHNTSTVNGISAPPKAGSCTTTQPGRSSTKPSYTHSKPGSLTTSSTKRNSIISSSCRTDTGSRLSWYDPLSSKRFQLEYVDETLEDEECDECDSSDIEEPTVTKSVPQAIQESILYFNTVSDIPVPAFVEKRSNIPTGRVTKAPPDSKSEIPSRLPRQASFHSKTASSHVKKPSLVPLDTTKSFVPILEKDPDSLDDSDSLYEFSLPTNSASTSLTSASLFPTREAAEAYAREQIDLEVEAAIKESFRLEEERKAREAEEDAEFLRALHESIIAEKEAQARREDLEFLDRLFSRSRPVSPAFSTCSSLSSRSSVYSTRRNSTVLTVLSPAPARSPIKLSNHPTTSPRMPATATDAPAPMSHNSKERPISAVRERKPKAKGSAGELYETSKDGPTIRPTLQRSHTSTSGGFRRLLGLSGRSTQADNSDDER
ncbi:hypothetical protein ABW19_dt0200629 [Dactylella cylindrospora]|nr:hypothetical protein ABW19_dt0200629 [Dactylella cylindrospora]